ncbi:TrbI/VirB10 family protein [Piscirickettsia litoralis]|uniref:Conjugal transfer protein TrbI n=1 Tax=Piscirickettsia litoralis TaxID=1891921 RepID=A0ABX3A5D6_9GAMM|nr:TrbI/VirB10 family protein [Piscirickettsia litoralis]ODN43839.1 conjugal transfer protein TrbI [Piscirickettsia litoralis]
MKLKTIKRAKSFLSAHPRLRVLIIFIVIMSIIVILVNNLAQPKAITSLGGSYVSSPDEHMGEGATKYTNKVYDQMSQTNQAEEVKQAETQGKTLVAESTQNIHPQAYKMNQQDRQIEEITGSHIFKKILHREAVQKQYQPVERATQKQNNTAQEKQQRTQEYFAAVSEKTAQMDSQIKRMSGRWGHVAVQQGMVAKVAAASGSANAGQLQGDHGNVIEKAGSILFAVLDTQLNSDQPGTPVMATIVQGKFKKAKLLGSFKRENDKLVIIFDRMSLPALDHTISIKAYAINATTAQNALASDVDNHYLLRYGGLFASAFLQGFGEYFSQSASGGVCGSSSTCIVTGDQSNNEANRTTRKAIYSGFGQVGSILADKASREFDRPPTVTLNQGVGMGILFMSDVKV